MIDITQVILAVIALLSAVVTGFLIPWIKLRTTAQQQEQLAAWVEIAVSAAEQIFAGVGRGAEKKEYVKAWLAERGLTFDEKTIDAAIEASVYQLKN